MPNGFVIKDFQVEQTGNNWTISLLPAKCGSPLPLLAVVDALEGNSSKDKATYTVKGLTSNVQITRIQKASPRQWTGYRCLIFSFPLVSRLAQNAAFASLDS